MKFESARDMYYYLFEKKCDGRDTRGFAELTDDVSGTSARVRNAALDGPGELLIEEPFFWKKGQTVRVVMVSRFGDMGLTSDLEAMYGYITRLPADTLLLTNCRTEL